MGGLVPVRDFPPDLDRIVIDYLFPDGSRFIGRTVLIYAPTRADVFINLCQNYRIEFAQVFANAVRFSPEDIRANNNEIFAAACARSETARWFAEKYNIGADEVRDGILQALHTACEYRQLRVVKWLSASFYSAQDLRASHNNALFVAIIQGALKIAQWLTETFRLDLEDVRDCRSIHELGTPNRDRAIRDAYRRDHIATVTWLIREFYDTDDSARDAFLREGLYVDLCENRHSAMTRAALEVLRIPPSEAHRRAMLWRALTGHYHGGAYGKARRNSDD